MSAPAVLFERLLEPYLVLDSELAIVAMNAAWRERFAPGRAGFAEDDPRAANLPDALDPKQRQLVDMVAANLRPGESRLSQIFRLDAWHHAPEAAADTRYWRIFASFIPAGADQPALITLRFEDVTARTLAKEERRREKARVRSQERLRKLLVLDEMQRSDHRLDAFRQALMQAGLGLWEMDVATGAVRCNEHCLSDIGNAQVAHVGWDDLLGGSPGDVAANRALLEAGRPFEYEKCVPAADPPRWTLVRGIGLLGENRTLQSIMGFTLDVTSHKCRELELAAQADAERSARERSETTARTMDQFIAAVSHELRSPLNAIVSWAEFLRLAAEPSHVARASEAIRRNGRQLALMVDDLLDSGAIATGKLSVNLQPVDLGALAAIVVEDMRKPIQEKGIALGARDIAPCVVMADESRIKQVLWNLLTNALKFTESGSIDVCVTAANGIAQLTVRDTGRGIEPDALPLIFDRFQQFTPQSSGRIGGLGLGLWIATHIVNLHGGTLTAASDGLGRGSTFTVTLTLASAHAH